MKKIGIFYGSTTGVTKKIAEKIGAKLKVNPNDIHDICRVGPAAVGEYDILLLGSSTWGRGDLQEDWLDFGNGMQALDLSDKTIALFGCGNEKMAKTFCNAVGKLNEIAKTTGAKIIGQFNAEGFNFKESEAAIPDMPLMKGLVIDEVNHSNMTDSRIDAWCKLISEEIQ